jgi:Holliday junction resolvase
MPGGSGPKNKGYRYENELRLDLVASGFTACRRVPLSGAGEEKDDLTFQCGWGEQERIEAKRRKALPSYLTSALSGGATAVAFREDRGSTYVLITWDRYKELCQ